ncbi:MAG: YbhB/YbcL family Raf kinase inhibitor-like protein [Varibaculum sp.]|nr:YbhB/YbcL family Raf kinase inhibitor-like protein [Varibaculum sp.]
MVDLLSRPTAPTPAELLPSVPVFSVSSSDFVDGGQLPFRLSVAGGSVSPQLSWSGFPAETKSFAVTCYDPDAPTGCGWWHWLLIDIPVETTVLDRGIGESDLLVDGAAFHLRNDGGTWAYNGANPPAGDRPHRYIFTVHALDVDTLSLDEDASAAVAGFNLTFHGIARASITGTFQQ